MYKIIVKDTAINSSFSISVYPWYSIQKIKYIINKIKLIPFQK